MSNPHAAASAMRANAAYVRQHLGEVALSDEHRALVLALCSSWEVLYFDLIDDELGAGLAERWTRGVIEEQHRVVNVLDAVVRGDPLAASAYVLVSEGAANVLKAYRRADSTAL